jgi:putative ABC transport system substrate-binding protein
MRRREFITLLGGAVAWPLSARAQQLARPLIGFMSARSPEDSAHLVAAFRQGLAENGFVEGQTVAIEFRWAHGDYDRLPALAADLVSRKVAVLVAVGGDVSAVAATKATRTIPVVFGIGSDPVKAGLVASFNRPGGNVTGYTLWTSEMESKRLGLMRELVPGVSLIGILVNPQFPPTVQELADLEPAAKSVNQQLFVARADNDAELDTALASFVQQRVGAFLVTGSPFFDTRMNRIVGFARKIACPPSISFVNTRSLVG